MSGTSKFLKLCAQGLLIWGLSIGLALRLGAVPDASFDLIVQMRLPRIILASFIGMGLSVSGAVLQALFSNPLCEPYTLGISSGAALGAILGASLGLDWMIAGLGGTAFLGALAFSSVLYLISCRSETRNITLL